MRGLHWSAAYIGLPWAKQGEGPDSFHCWAFVRHVQREQFGRRLSPIPNGSTRWQVKQFRDHPEFKHWRRVSTPLEGDCLLLARNQVPIHVGIWVEPFGGSLLHCVEGDGVVLQDREGLAMNGWTVTGCYRYLD